MLRGEKKDKNIKIYFLILKRGVPGFPCSTQSSCRLVLSNALDLCVDTTYLQVLQNLHGTKDFNFGAGVVVAQKDFSLVRVQPWAEGHLSPNLLFREVAAQEGCSDQQYCLLHAQVLSLLVRQFVHCDQAEVLACGDKGVPLCPLLLLVGPEKEDAYQEESLVASWAQI